MLKYVRLQATPDLILGSLYLINPQFSLGLRRTPNNGEIQ